MANSKQALKRSRQNVTKRIQNQRQRTLIRSRVRAVREAVAANDLTNIDSLLQSATATLHKVSGKGVIHTKNADRRISRLAKAVANMKKSATSAQA